MLGIFALLVGHVLPSGAQQAFYIYRNDGHINTFVTTEIDSMTYSRVGLDGSVSDEYVVQEVYAQDSVYRIPIALIDSVGFVTPETVYQPGVKVIEGEMRDYIISRDGLTLLFKASTPGSLLPKVGDKLVTTEVDDVITNSFVGEVASVTAKGDGIAVACDPVALEDIFECYYGVVQKRDEPLPVGGQRKADGFFGDSGTLTPGKLTADLLDKEGKYVMYEKDDGQAYVVGNAKASVSVTPTINYNAYLVITKDYGTTVGVSMVGDYTLEEYLALSGEMNASAEVTLFEKGIHIPQAFLDLDFELGAFANAKAKVSTEQTWAQKYRHVFHWSWNNKHRETLANVNSFKKMSSEYKGKLALDGDFNMGAFAKIGVDPFGTSSFDVAEINLRLDGGVGVDGSFVAYKSDAESAKKSTDLYNQIKDSEVGLYWFYGLSAEAKLFSWSVSTQIPNFFNIPFSKKEKMAGLRLVPLFSDTELSLDEEGTYHASTKLGGGSVSKTDAGFALINKEDASDATYSYCVYDYEGPKAEAYASFYNKPTASEYTLYPLVKYMGMEMIAEPSAEIDEGSVTFKSAEVTNVESEPRYNGDGEYLFTWYTANFKYVIQIKGADLIDYIQPVVYDNGAWSYNGGKTKVPGNGLYSVTTSMSYDNEADMDWATGYCITLKDGSTVYSKNMLQFGGTPESPTIVVSDNPNVMDVPHNALKESGHGDAPILNEIVLEKIG